MEKPLFKKPSFYLKSRSLAVRKKTVIEPLSFKSVADPKNRFTYPAIKLPEQPQGYIKCKKHDCL
ncbi:MAG TPA: hypothetical protein VLD19_22120 [Chitinophagaceae bacterium]|nr:hypothetical protein [Chitinophagaceae bacterium]